MKDDYKLIREKESKLYENRQRRLNWTRTNKMVVAAEGVKPVAGSAECRHLQCRDYANNRACRAGHPGPRVPTLSLAIHPKRKRMAEKMVDY